MKTSCIPNAKAAFIAVAAVLLCVLGACSRSASLGEIVERLNEGCPEKCDNGELVGVSLRGDTVVYTFATGQQASLEALADTSGMALKGLKVSLLANMAELTERPDGYRKALEKAGAWMQFDLMSASGSFSLLMSPAEVADPLKAIKAICDAPGELPLVLGQISAELPIDMGEGLEMVTVTDSGHMVEVTFDVDEQLVELTDEGIQAVVKHDMLESLTSSSSLYELMVYQGAGCGIAYRYVMQPSGRTVTVSLTPDELRGCIRNICPGLLEPER